MSDISGHDEVSRKQPRKLRYVVVGLGHIAQAAVLPAFAHASENSELVALVSDDPAKRKKLGKKYGITQTFSYEEYDDCLHSGAVDAVYITLPNHMHCEYSVRAAEAGIHVLCEKPMAVTEDECLKMITAAESSQTKLMIAYRLHFEEANLTAAEIVRTGQLGEPRLFNSVFSMKVRAGDIRVQREMGGGTLYDLGVYCINAARSLFRDEPTEVTAFAASGDNPRFKEVDEMTGAVMRFPHERLATFITSFGASDISQYQIAGTEGDLRLDPAYGYATKLTQYLTLKGRTKKQVFSKRDQFAPEILHFSQCVLERRDPEPSGWEGLADVRVVRALYESADRGQPVQLPRFEKRARPEIGQEIERPPVKEPELVHAESPHAGE
jgi:glucose-fructose oxidoreductase